MSLSKEKPVGTIFMGPNSDRETTLERLYESSGQEMWTQRTEEEYMERVRAKATERVRSLLVKARERGAEILAQGHKDAEAVRAEAELILADANRTLEEARAVRAEAEDIRAQAEAQREAGYQEGSTQGHADVMAQLAVARQELGETVGVVLLGIHEQCGSIFEAWRGQLTDLFKEAVEKSTGLIVNGERRAMFENLLEQSMRALLDRSQYTVKVNPEDAELLTEMLADAHQASPRTANWELATDPTLEPGSLVVESSMALVDNSRGARQSVVDEVLQHLSIPMSQADQDAFTQVTNSLVGGLKKNGVSFESAGDEQAAPDSPATSDVEPSAPPASSAEATPEVGVPPAPDLHADASNMEFQIPEGMIPQEESQTAAPPVVEAVAPETEAGMLAPMPEEAVMPEAAQPEEASVAPPVQDIPPMEEAPAPAPVAEMPPPVEEDSAQLAHQEAQGLVEEFLSDSGLGDEALAGAAPSVEDEGQNPGLPPDLADELLADMGFGGETEAVMPAE